MATGAKYDGGKPRPSLVLGTMSRAIRAVVNVAEHGAQKYSADNWLLVPDGINRYTDAMLRHLVAEQAGEAKDADSGLLHAAHAAWGALARLDLMLRKAEQVEDYRICGPKTWHATPDGGVRPAGRVAAPDHAVDALRYTFGVDFGETAAELRAKRDAAEVQDKRDAMRALSEAGLLNMAFKQANAAASLKLDDLLRKLTPQPDAPVRAAEVWSEQLVRWLRYYSHTFSRYEAEGLLRAEYASNTESLRVVGVAKRRYDGLLAVVHDLPRDGTAAGGVEALGLAVDRAVAHWDELAKQSATKLGGRNITGMWIDEDTRQRGIDYAERVARRVDAARAREPARTTFSQWAQKVEAKLLDELRVQDFARDAWLHQVHRAPTDADMLFVKLRDLSPLFVRLEAQRQLVATYDCSTSRLAIEGVKGGQYDGFAVGMRNVNPSASNFDASMCNLVRTLGEELFKVDQRRANQAQRDFEQRIAKQKAEQAERERREKAQQEQALLRRHHLAATNPLRICRAKLKHILSMASLPVTRRLEQLRRADRLRLELHGCELRLIVCDPNGAALVCLNQVIDLLKPRLEALEEGTRLAFNRLLSVPRLESLITPTGYTRKHR